MSDPSKPNPRIRMPASVKAGEVFEVRTLVTHAMESGQRRDAQGNLVPRKILKAFSATFEGEEVFRAEWHGAVSANPFQMFHVRVAKSGTFVFRWVDDDGSVVTHEQKIAVT
jgi:sulfur-oxidizing protein SoxZ